MHRIIIVTGATSGIGKAITEKFLANGDSILAIGRDITKLQDIIAVYPDNCLPYTLDVSDKLQIEQFSRNIAEKYNTIDGLINCAGFSKVVSTKTTFQEAINSWESVIGTNLTGAFMMSLATAPLLKRPGGRIINISSIGAFTGGSAPGGLPYAASKAGLHGLTYGLARELSPDGITVNAIAPGFIKDTAFTAVYPPDMVAHIVNLIPAKRAGSASEIAEICFFLASDVAAYITGEIINVNGGWLFGR